MSETLLCFVEKFIVLIQEMPKYRATSSSRGCGQRFFSKMKMPSPFTVLIRVERGTQSLARSFIQNRPADSETGVGLEFNIPLFVKFVHSGHQANDADIDHSPPYHGVREV